MENEDLLYSLLSLQEPESHESSLHFYAIFTYD